MAFQADLSKEAIADLKNIWYDFLTLKLKDIRTIIQTKKKLPRETSDSISDAAFLLIKIMIKTFTST